jgi:hypothetical protein
VVWCDFFVRHRRMRGLHGGRGREKGSRAYHSRKPSIRVRDLARRAGRVTLDAEEDPWIVTFGGRPEPDDLTIDAGGRWTSACDPA